MLKANFIMQVNSGTPLILTSGADPFQISLYFVDPNNFIRQVYTKDMALLDWRLGDLYDISSAGFTQVTAAERSRMAGYWLYCQCAGSKDGNNKERIFVQNDI